MEVYLIRHTTPEVASGVCYGQSDIPLTSHFGEEALAVASTLPKSFDKVYTSPLKRCVALAETLVTSELITDDRLMELNFGAWELKPWDSLPQKELDVWMTDFVHEAPPQGESMVQLQERVLAWWGELDQCTDQKVAIVTHGGVIRVIKCHFNNIPLVEAFGKFKVNYGEVSQLHLGK